MSPTKNPAQLRVPQTTGNRRPRVDKHPRRPADSDDRERPELVLQALLEALERRVSNRIDEELAREVRCYSIAEAADRLGISERSVRREIEDGNLIAITVRSKPKITHPQLKRYIESCELK